MKKQGQIQDGSNISNTNWGKIEINYGGGTAGNNVLLNWPTWDSCDPGGGEKLKMKFFKVALQSIS